MKYSSLKKVLFLSSYYTYDTTKTKFKNFILTVSSGFMKALSSLPNSRSTSKYSFIINEKKEKIEPKHIESHKKHTRACTGFIMLT
jgi:hypothetical protein